MTKREFIRKNRKEIDAFIRGAMNREDLKINDREREMWMLNDEMMYRWARREGVKI